MLCINLSIIEYGDSGDYIEIVRLFITAEWVSEENLHLYIVKKMLNPFGATDTITMPAVLKVIHSQLMHDLPQNSPWILQKLSQEEHHGVRRSKDG